MNGLLTLTPKHCSQSGWGHWGVCRENGAERGLGETLGRAPRVAAFLGSQGFFSIIATGIVSVMQIWAPFTRKSVFCSFLPAVAQVEYCSVFHALGWPGRVPVSLNRVWNWSGGLNTAKKSPAIQPVQEQGLTADFAGTIFTPEKCFQAPKGLIEQIQGRHLLGKGSADQKSFLPVS